MTDEQAVEEARYLLARCVYLRLHDDKRIDDIVLNELLVAAQ